MNTKVMSMLIIVATVTCGCAAQQPNCPHRDNICNVGMAQILDNPERYRADQQSRRGYEIRYQGRRTGLTIEPRSSK